MAAEVRAAEARHVEDHKKMGALTNHIRRLTLQLQAERGAVLRERAKRARQGGRRPSPAVWRGGAAGAGPRGGLAMNGGGGGGEAISGAAAAGGAALPTRGGTAAGAAPMELGSVPALCRPPAPAAESPMEGVSACGGGIFHLPSTLLARLSEEQPVSHEDHPPVFHEDHPPVFHDRQLSVAETWHPAVSDAGHPSLAGTAGAAGSPAPLGVPASSILGGVHLGHSDSGNSILEDHDLASSILEEALAGFSAFATAAPPSAAPAPSARPAAPAADAHHWACRLALACEGGPCGTGPPSVLPPADTPNLDALMRPTASWIAHHAPPRPRQPAPLADVSGLDALMRPTLSWNAHHMTAQQEAQVREQMREAVAQEETAARIAARVSGDAGAGRAAQAAAAAEEDTIGGRAVACSAAGAGVLCAREAAGDSEAAARDPVLQCDRSRARAGAADPSHRAPTAWAEVTCDAGTACSHQMRACSHQMRGRGGHAQPSRQSSDLPLPISGPSLPCTSPPEPAQSAPPSHPQPAAVPGVFYSSDRQHAPVNQLRPYGERAAAAAACRRELASRAAEQASLFVHAKQAAACLALASPAGRPRSVPALPSAARPASAPPPPPPTAAVPDTHPQGLSPPQRAAIETPAHRAAVETASRSAPMGAPGLASPAHASTADASATFAASVASTTGAPAVTAVHAAAVAAGTAAASVTRPASAPVARTAAPPIHCVSAQVAQVLTARALAGCPPPTPETFAALDPRPAHTEPQLRTSTPQHDAPAAAPPPALPRPTEPTRPALGSAERAASLAAAVHDIRSLLAAVPGLQLPEEMMAALPLFSVTQRRAP
eukprot:scaffold9250_cov105-Isochrysis_galbana.AAC.4